MAKTICNYLKKNLSLKDYADLIETWEVHRGADGEENVYDLMDYADFFYFASFYTLSYALECQKEARFWFGGTNYSKDSIGSLYKTAVPFPMFTDGAYKLAKVMIGEEYVMERTDLYEKYYDFEAYEFEEKYKPNNEHTSHALEYPLVLQYFTLLISRNSLVTTNNIREEYGYNDILNRIANMAYDFTELYKNTEWETTFLDYALHYIVRNFKAYFENLYEDETQMEEAISVFVYYPEYYD